MRRDRQKRENHWKKIPLPARVWAAFASNGLTVGVSSLIDIFNWTENNRRRRKRNAHRRRKGKAVSCWSLPFRIFVAGSLLLLIYFCLEKAL